MANIHVLDSPGPGRFRVAYHVAIPASNNPAGVPWRTAVKNSLALSGAPATVLPDGDGTGGTVASTEKADLAAGVLFEVIREEKGQTGAGLGAMFARRSGEVLQDLQARLAQFGRTA